MSLHSICIGRIGDDTHVSSNSPGGSTGGKVCRLWLHLVIFESIQSKSLTSHNKNNNCNNSNDNRKINWSCYSPPPVGVRSIACLHVRLFCLFAGIPQIPRVQISPNLKMYLISCTRYLWPWLGPPLTAVWYVMYFRFCEWRHGFI